MTSTIYVDIDIDTPAYASGRVVRVEFSETPINSASAFAVDLQRLEPFGEFQISHEQLELAREANQDASAQSAFDVLHDKWRRRRDGQSL